MAGGQTVDEAVARVAERAERHLRLLGEEQLSGAAEQRRPGLTPLGECAKVLVALGAIPALLAQRIVDDYAFAVALRDPNEHALQFFLATRAASSGARVARSAGSRPAGETPVLFQGGVLDLPVGRLTVAHVSITNSSVELTGQLHFSGNPAVTPSRRRMRPSRAMQQLPALQIVDALGAKRQAHFSGSWGGNQAEGRYDVSGTFSTKAEWLEVDGVRFPLRRAPGGATVTVEPVADATTVATILRSRISALNQWSHEESIDSTLDALVVAGAVAAGDPILEAARVNADAVFARLTQGSRALTGKPTEPWKSLLARAQMETGPTGTLALGVTAPDLDGISLRVLHLVSEGSGFSLAVELESAGDEMRHPLHERVDAVDVTWWARDDLGNEYSGRLESHHGFAGSFQGQIGFWPGLDPRAGTLDVTIELASVRAHMNVPLTWQP